MNRILKKSLSVFLAVVMMVSAVPLGGFVGIELPNFGAIFSFAADEDVDVDSINSHLDDFTYTAKFNSSMSNKVASFKFLYDDCFFDKAATDGINTGLAAASIYMSSAAYYVYKDTQDVDHVGTGDLLDEMGYDNICTYNYDFETDISNLAPATKENCDFVAYTFATKDYKSSDGNQYKLIAIMVRGTPGSPEWYGNFHIGEEGIYHQGFRLASNELLQSFDKYINQIGYDKNTTKIWITGHSRGASVANLVAASLNENEKYAKMENIFAYTFACPSVSTNANTSYTNIYNFCNNGDLISFLPLDRWGFKKAGKTVNFNLYGKEKDMFGIISGEPYNGLPGVDYLTDCFYNVADSAKAVYDNDVDELLMILAAYLCKEINMVECKEALTALSSLVNDWFD